MKKNFHSTSFSGKIQKRVFTSIITGLLLLLGLSSEHSLQAQNLIIDKQVSNATPSPGQNFTFRIRYRCASLTQDCQDAQIVDTIPSGLQVVSYTGVGGLVEDVDLSGSTLTWDLGDGSGVLPAGSTGTLFLTAKLPKCGPTIANGTVYTNTATFSATGATSSLASATVTLNGAIAPCPPPPPAVVDTNFRKTSLREEGVIDGPLQQWIITLPDPAQTSGTATYTVTDTFPDNIVVVGLEDIGDWTAGTGSIGTLEVQCRNSGNWYAVDKENQNRLIYDDGTSPYNAADYRNLLDGGLPDAFLECAGVDNPDIARTNSTSGGYLNITGIRFTVDESLLPGPSSNSLQPQIKVSYYLLSESPFAGINTPNGLALPNWVAPVPGDVTQNCVQSSIDMDSDTGTQDEVCGTIELFGPGTGALEPTKSVAANLSELPGGPINNSFLDPNASPPRVLTPNTLMWRFNVRKTHFSGDVQGIKVFELLDANLEYDPAENWYVVIPVNGALNGYTGDLQTLEEQSDCANPDFTVIPNYRNTGRTALIWDFKSCYFGPTPTDVNGTGNRDQLNIYLATTVKEGTLPNTNLNDAYIILYDNQGVEQIISGCEPNNNTLDNFFDESDPTAPAYSYDGQSDLFDPAWSNTDRTYTDLLDLTDLDGNGLTANEFLCASDVSSFNMPTIADLTSEKLVKGKLDAQFSKYPASGNTDISGEGVYELTIENTGNVNVTQIDVVDILSFVGDVGVLPSTGPRLSEWAEQLTNAITIERSTDGGATYSAVPSGDLPLGPFYSTSTDPERFSADNTSNFDVLTVNESDMSATNFPTGADDNPWTGATSSGAAGARSFGFRFVPISTSGNFASGDILRITVPIEIIGNPPGCSTPNCTGVGDNLDNGAIAWNSFAFGGSYEDSGTQRLLDSEPIKVGLKMVDPAQTAGLGDFVWNDLNGNGIQDTGEPGFEGVSVGLYQEFTIDDGLIDINNDGLYNSDDDGFVDGLNIIDGRVDVDGDGDVDADDDKGTSQSAIGDLPVVDGYVDVDGDATPQEMNGEDDGTFIGKIDNTLTDVNGEYLFVGLDPDNDYIVRLDNAANFGTGGLLETYSLTSPDQGGDALDSDAVLNADNEPEISVSNADLTAGSNTLTYDFGFVQTNTVGDFVWYDVNEFGDQTGGEPGAEGVTVTLTNVDGNDIDLQMAGVQSMVTTTTDAFGAYLFEDVPNGTYTVTFDKSTLSGNDPDGMTVVPGDWVFTAANQTSDNFDSDAVTDGLNPNLATTPEFILTGGQENLTLDAGLRPAPPDPIQIKGTVFDDFSGAGTPNVYDNGTDALLEGIEVVLYDPVMLEIDRTFTDANGNYVFSNLPPLSTGETYQVFFVLPINADFVLQDQGMDEALDSEVDPNTAEAIVTEAMSTNAINNNMSMVVDIDAGMSLPFSIGNIVWNDLNFNGELDAGEQGVAGISVRLLDDLGNPVDDPNQNGIQDYVTTTDANGRYLFSGLPAETYTVEIDIPAGFRSTADDAQGDNTLADDPIQEDNDDSGNGTQLGASSIASATITLPGTPFPAANNGEADATVPINGQADNTPDYKAYYTVDFGIAPVLSIGNRVFADNGAGTGTEDDGIQSGAEPGIDGVTVRLYLDPDGDGNLSNNTAAAQVGTDQVTAGGGFYLFDNLAPTTGSERYFVVVAETEFGAGQELNGLISSTPNGSDLSTDLDDNGTNTIQAGFGIVSNAIELTAGNQPLGESGPTSGNAADNNSNLTIDFGFVLLNLDYGDLPDPNYPTLLANNGPRHIIDPGIQIGGAVDAETDGQQTAQADGDDNNGDDEDGVTFPTAIIAGTPADLTVNVTNTTGSAATLYGWIDFNNNGQLETGERASFTVNDGTNAQDVTLTFTALQTTGAVTGTDLGARFRLSTDLTAVADPTGPATDGEVEDYLIQVQAHTTVALGNLVFLDANNNGQFDPGIDQGIDGVEVQLLDDNDMPVDNPNMPGNPYIVTTSGGGFYEFDNLLPGNYKVFIPAGNFGGSQPLDGLVSSSPEGIDNDQDDNADENGQNTLFNGGVISTVIELTVGGEPENEGGQGAYSGILDDNSANMTVDFGFFAPVSVGNFVWVDLDNDGFQDSNEPGLEDVTVTIFDATTNTAVALGADNMPYSSTQMTDAMGAYLFQNLPPGDYYVQFDLSTAANSELYDFTSLNNADDAADSDADTNITGNDDLGQSGRTGFLPSNTQDLTLDAGVFCAAMVEAGNPANVCRNAEVNLGSLGATYTPSSLTAIWTTSGDGDFLDMGGNVLTAPVNFNNAVTYRPGTMDIQNGTVTLTLTTDTGSACGTISDNVILTVFKTDCGNFPWDGN